MKTLTTIAVLTTLVSVANAGNDNTWQRTSVYVAGKAKYCKETSVSGYLDCFYANLDACEKHNKTAALRCVVNPNFGR